MVLVLKSGSVYSWPDLFSRAVGSDSVTLSSNERLDSHLSKQGRLQITTDEQYVSRFSWSQNMTSLLFCFVSSTMTTWCVYWPITVLISHDSKAKLGLQLVGHVDVVAGEQNTMKLRRCNDSDFILRNTAYFHYDGTYLFLHVPNVPLTFAFGPIKWHLFVWQYLPYIWMTQRNIGSRCKLSLF